MTSSTNSSNLVPNFSKS